MLFLSWDLKYTGLVMNLGSVPFCSMGDLSEISVEVKTHNEKASTAQDSALAVGVKRDNNPTQFLGAVTRISGYPSWNRLGKYMEWAAIDTLVKLTKGNVDAAHTS